MSIIEILFNTARIKIVDTELYSDYKAIVKYRHLGNAVYSLYVINSTDFFRRAQIFNYLVKLSLSPERSIY